MPPRNREQRLRQCRRLRGIRKRHIDIVRGQPLRCAAPGRLKLRTNGDLGFALRRFLRGGNYFGGDGAQLGFGEGLLAAANQAEEQRGSEDRKKPRRKARKKMRAKKISGDERICVKSSR